MQYLFPAAKKTRNFNRKRGDRTTNLEAVQNISRAFDTGEASHPLPANPLLSFLRIIKLGRLSIAYFVKDLAQLSKEIKCNGDMN